MIVNWNGAADTVDLIHSLCECQSNWLCIDVVIIDNASAQKDLQILQAAISNFDKKMDLKLRVNAINIGVPAAYNQAIQVAGLGYDHYLRLDNDVVVNSLGLAALIDALAIREKDGVAIVGGNVRFFDNPELDNGGAVAINLVRGVTSVSYPSSDVICDGVLGCIMLVSGSLVRRCTPDVFEGVLFICTDESELSLRAATYGLSTLYIAQVIGLHKGGRSTSKVHFLSKYYTTRNWIFHRLRYTKRGIDRCAVLAWIQVDIASSVLRGRWAYPLGVIAGIGLAVTWMLDHRIKRANV